jgi:CheY-like chemotaxis protein
MAKSVLIVDDNADIREIYDLKFRREGFETQTAEDGRRGLSAMRAKLPDAVILDIQMPVMDGIEVLEEMKKDPTLSDVPVVVLSNVDSDEMFQRVSDLGRAEYYLVKALVDPQKVIDVTLEAIAS